jgi:hypothetical protein
VPNQVGSRPRATYELKYPKKSEPARIFTLVLISLQEQVVNRKADGQNLLLDAHRNVHWQRREVCTTPLKSLDVENSIGYCHDGDRRNQSGQVFQAGEDNEVVFVIFVQTGVLTLVDEHSEASI